MRVRLAGRARTRPRMGVGVGAGPPGASSRPAADRGAPRAGAGSGSERPVSFIRRTMARSPWYRTTLSDPGPTTMRWNLSSGWPSASERIALITSPWDTTATTPSGCFADQSAMAVVARCAIPSIDSPPGKVTDEGVSWITGQSGSLASSARDRPVQSP